MCLHYHVNKGNVMTQAQLQARNAELIAEREQLHDSIQKLQQSNHFKWTVLMVALGVSSASLVLSIWSVLDHEPPGFGEAGVALSGVSLGLSVLGVFKDCFSSRGDEPDCVEKEHEMGTASAMGAV